MFAKTKLRSALDFILMVQVTEFTTPFQIMRSPASIVIQLPLCSKGFPLYDFADGPLAQISIPRKNFFLTYQSFGPRLRLLPPFTMLPCDRADLVSRNNHQHRNKVPPNSSATRLLLTIPPEPFDTNLYIYQGKTSPSPSPPSSFSQSVLSYPQPSFPRRHPR